MNKQRFFIATSGNDDEAYLEAMLYTCILTEKDPQIKKVVLLLNSKQNTGWFERIFGREIEKKLFKGATFKNCGSFFKFETLKTYKDSNTPSEIVIACGLDSEKVFPIDNFNSVKAIIAIPWLANGIDKWVQTWNPIEIRGNQQAVAVYQDPTCIVKKAMQDLTSNINSSTGISNPSDEERAKTYILSLHKYETNLDANIVGAYLVRELNWNSIHAKEMEKLINTLNQGGHFKGGKRKGLQIYYKQWKEECEQQ
jgi:hypothetical protein